MRALTPVLALLAAFTTHSVLAQPAEPARVRGTVQSFDGSALVLTTETQGTVTLTVGESTGINGLERKTADDIGPNAFIGTTAVKDSRGRWRATEVHIFPEAMRGAGEGHYAWDLPESTMTNAAVTGTAAKRRGRTLHLKYSTNQGSATGGEVDVDITRKTAIVALTAGERSLLVPGAVVFALATPEQDGKANAIAIVAETKGVKPPM